MNVIAFWRSEVGDTDPHPEYGQWYRSEFSFRRNTILPQEIIDLNLCVDKPEVVNLLKNRTYNTAEKFMMIGKAALFNDLDMIERMSRENNPKNHKALGRRVRNFDDDTWDMYCCDIVKLGNYLKFSQDNNLKQLIIRTGDAILVEGSPIDFIWGVGLKFDNPNIRNPELWRGTNFLGECLMFVRIILQNE